MPCCFFFWGVMMMPYNPKSLENLKKSRPFTTENASEIGKKGCAARQASMRRIRTMRDLLRALGKLRADDPATAAMLEDAGIMPDKLAAATLKVIEKAEKGDLKAWELWRDTTGEAPKQAVGISVDQSSADAIKGLSDADLAAIAADAAEAEADAAAAEDSCDV